MVSDVANRNFKVIMRMENKTKHSGRSGHDPVVVFTLILVGLKATGFISWPWLWVLSPIWLTSLFFAVVFSAILFGGRIAKGKW